MIKYFLTKEDINLIAQWFKRDGKLFFFHCYKIYREKLEKLKKEWYNYE